MEKVGGDRGSRQEGIGAGERGGGVIEGGRGDYKLMIYCIP